MKTKLIADLRVIHIYKYVKFVSFIMPRSLGDNDTILRNTHNCTFRVKTRF